MGKETKISWCDATWNCWTGCTKTAPECTNCYVERWTKRIGRDFNEIWRTSDITFYAPLKWKEPKKIFVESLGDFFHEDVNPRWRAEAWQVMVSTSRHTYIILTKRPQNIIAMLPSKKMGWPECYQHIWFLVSAGTNETLARFWPILRDIPGLAVRGVSMEPLLEELDLSILDNSPPSGYNPVHGICKGTRRGTLSSGSGWGVGDRLRGTDLESGVSDRRQQPWRGAADPLRKAQSREQCRSLSSDSGDVQLAPRPCGCSSSGLSAFSRTDSSRNDSESQEWPEEGQSPMQSGIGHAQRPGDSQSARTEAWPTRKVGEPLSIGQTDGGASSADPRAEGARREIAEYSKGLRGGFSDCLEDCPQRTLVSWVIVSGESGPNRRPMNPDWAGKVGRWCGHNGVPFFFKGHIGNVHTPENKMLDGKVYHEFPRVESR